MKEINWVTVIVSVILSTITVGSIVYNIISRYIRRVDRITTSFIDEVKTLTINSKNN